MGRPWKGDEPVECMGDGEVQMVAFTVAPPHVGRDCDEQRERRAEAWAERAKVKKEAGDTTDTEVDEEEVCTPRPFPLAPPPPRPMRAR